MTKQFIFFDSGGRDQTRTLRKSKNRYSWSNPLNAREADLNNPAQSITRLETKTGQSGESASAAAEAKAVAMQAKIAAIQNQAVLMFTVVTVIFVGLPSSSENFHFSKSTVSESIVLCDIAIRLGLFQALSKQYPGPFWPLESEQPRKRTR